MTFSAGVHETLDLSGLESVDKNIDDVIKTALRKGGFDVEGDAKKRIRMQGAIDTGALFNSIYTVFSWQEQGTYHSAVAQASQANPQLKVIMLPATPTAKPGEYSAVIGSVVHYAIYVEKGTEKMPPRPFLVPALHGTIGSIEAMMKRVLQELPG